MTQTILVTGASGHLGRRVVELLLDAEAGPIIATTRTPEKLADLAKRGVEVRTADFDRPETLVPAFSGADRLLLVSTDAVMVPGQRLQQHKAAVNAAVEAGVSHIFYTSFTNSDPGSPITVSGDHYGTEQAMAASSLKWTSFRNNMYTEMLLGSLPQAIANGQLIAATGEGGVGFVTREDCARAAAAALANPDLEETMLDITGPEVVTYTELADIVSDISGRRVAYHSIPTEAMLAGMLDAGLPPTLAEFVVSMQTATAQGNLALVTDTVTELTGSAPQSVRDFLLERKEALLAPPM